MKIQLMSVDKILGICNMIKGLKMGPVVVKQEDQVSDEQQKINSRFENDLLEDLTELDKEVQDQPLVENQQEESVKTEIVEYVDPEFENVEFDGEDAWAQAQEWLHLAQDNYQAEVVQAVKASLLSNRGKEVLASEVIGGDGVPALIGDKCLELPGSSAWEDKVEGFDEWLEAFDNQLKILRTVLELKKTRGLVSKECFSNSMKGLDLRKEAKILQEEMNSLAGKAGLDEAARRGNLRQKIRITWEEVKDFEGMMYQLKDRLTKLDEEVGLLWEEYFEVRSLAESLYSPRFWVEYKKLENFEVNAHLTTYDSANVDGPWSALSNHGVCPFEGNMDEALTRWDIEAEAHVKSQRIWDQVSFDDLNEWAGVQQRNLLSELRFERALEVLARYEYRDSVGHGLNPKDLRMIWAIGERVKALWMSKHPIEFLTYRHARILMNKVFELSAFKVRIPKKYSSLALKGVWKYVGLKRKELTQVCGKDPYMGIHAKPMNFPTQEELVDSILTQRAMDAYHRFNRIGDLKMVQL